MSIFFLLLATTLYYSFGYKYDFSTGKSFQMGAIVLRATPRDATIQKDGETVEDNGFLGGVFSPFIKIENLKPKQYSIKVTKDGYNEWQKNVDIKSGQVEKYENVIILKQSYEKQAVLEDVVLPTSDQKWLSAEKNKIIFIGKVALEEGLFIVNLENEEYDLILDKEQLALMGEIENVFWTEDDGRIVLKSPNNMYLIDIRDSGRIYSISSNIVEALNQNANSTIYLFETSIIFEEDNAIYSFDYVTKKTEKLLDNVDNFFVYQGSVYFFKTDTETNSPSLFSASLGDSSYDVRVSYLPTNYDSQAPFAIKKDGGNFIVLSSGSLYFIGKDAKSQKINSNVEAAHFFQSGKRILYYGNNEIWVYYIENKTSQPIKSEGDNELLTRFSGKLSNIYIYSDEEHIFFQENDVFKFTELDSRDHRNTFDILENTIDQEIFYIRGKNFLYYLTDNKFYKLDITEA